MTLPTSSPPGYDWTRSYQWNYDHAPSPPEPLPVVRDVGRWHLFGLPVGSPLGIAAGPLLNGRWILYYASLGFDVLTYKTVRRRAWPCYEPPNLQPVDVHALDQPPAAPLQATPSMSGSWAVSFGMPSQPPDVWRRDIERTRQQLPAGKLLNVSVVATPEPDASLEEVADDYAMCAGWAAESGADVVELNFSCPNVSTCDGQLYQHPAQARLVASRVRRRMGDKPLLIKMGQVTDRKLAEDLVDQLADQADALVMLNCVTARVAQGRQALFQGLHRGIAGPAIRDAALTQIRLFQEVIARRASALKIIGVGGVSDVHDVQAHLSAGVVGVQLATAAMVDPQWALKIRRDWPATLVAAGPEKAADVR